MALASLISQEDKPVPGAQSVLKAIALLELFSAQRTEMTVLDAAAAIGIPKSSAHRLLTVLRHRGYIRQERRGATYALGPRIVSLAAAYRASQPLSRVALPHMQALLMNLNETVGLFVRADGSRVLIERLESSHPMQVVMALGEPMPLGIGAAGKLLALGDAAARKAGVVISHGERVPNARAVAAPIFDHDGRMIAAIDLAGPNDRFTLTAVRRYGNEIRRTASAISHALGDRGTSPGG